MQLLLCHTKGESWIHTTQESPTCEMNTIPSPINITVAVEPDSTSSLDVSSLYKMKHHLNLQCNNIKSTITFYSCNLHLFCIKGKMTFTPHAYRYQLTNLTILYQQFEKPSLMPLELCWNFSPWEATHLAELRDTLCTIHPWHKSNPIMENTTLNSG